MLSHNIRRTSLTGVIIKCENTVENFEIFKEKWIYNDAYKIFQKIKVPHYVFNQRFENFKPKIIL